MKSTTPRHHHWTQTLRRVALAFLVVATLPWALQARDSADPNNADPNNGSDAAGARGIDAVGLRAAYFALAAEQRAEPSPDPEHVAELLEDLQRKIPGSAESRSGARFDSMTALREAARVALPHINAASGADPTRLSDEAIRALRVLLDPAAATRVLAPTGTAAASDIDPLLELSFERLAVLYEQQSQLQRLEFARHIDVSLDRFRALAAVTRTYAVRSLAHRAVVNGAEQDLYLSITDRLEQLSPLETAVVVLGSPELRRAVAAAEATSPLVQAFSTGLAELYERVDQAVAESDLSEAGFTGPRVEALRPTLGVGSLSESAIPYRRNLALSGVASGDAAGREAARRQILPHEIAAELYYSIFYELSYELSHELAEELRLPDNRHRRELWGRLHGQYLVTVPGSEAGSLSLEERFIAELEPEFQLLAVLEGSAAAEGLALELNDSILRSASRHIERPLSRWNMQPELYLGAAFRHLSPDSLPEQNYSAVRRILRELEQDTLGERRYLRAAAEQKRSDRRAVDGTDETAVDGTTGERP
ncbi:MAG: hypothetical protein EA428_07875 [Spirochaetaceae bacterium]|nr:MAG: hypothetical protein EA428_07875 [Spirochaetaceae bacterium]